MTHQVWIVKKKNADGSPAIEPPRIFAQCATVAESDAAKQRGAAELVNFDKSKFGYSAENDYWYANAADGRYWFYRP